jgi:cell division protein FtsL
MTLFACIVLTAVTLIYMFYPERNVAVQRQKTRLEYLRERQAMLYENLRDLNFENRAGKYSEEDYLAQRAQMENEAAMVLAEIDVIESAGQSRRGQA